jgi:gluconolactonase
MRTQAALAISVLLMAAPGWGQAPEGRGGARGGPPPGPREVTVAAIPGVIAAGSEWQYLWQEMGNNGDGIIAAPDGDLLIAQNDNSQVVKLDANGGTSVVYTGTRTGGSLSMDPSGRLLIVQRVEPEGAVAYLAPERRTLADTFDGRPLGELGRLNDLTADDQGGAYFTVGMGVYYARADGRVTRVAGDIAPNGIILSADGDTLYVTNRTVVEAFDVLDDGMLGNRREFGMLEGGGNGDGMTIDSAGRLYVTSASGVQVFSPDGAYLGIIPTPRSVISVAFAGSEKKTLYVLARGAADADGNEIANAAVVYRIPMLAQGFPGRAK